MSRKELLIAPACEAVLVLIVGLAGWLTQEPLIFASLGPTAYELVETPRRPSARPFCVIVGHLIAVLVGFAALALTSAGKTPPATSGHILLPRVWAAVLAAMFTVFTTLLVGATQPAAVSTTLLIALGVLQRWQDGVAILVAVLLMTLAGEPLRRWRAREKPEQ